VGSAQVWLASKIFVYFH